ncbi:MAG: hypothetical protein WBK11_06310 [Bacillota bacterium]|nr:hypothetical protein [Bacillota bacterium]
MLLYSSGESLRFAAEDFEWVMPVKKLPCAKLVPLCKGVVLALHNRSPGEGVLLCWILEVKAIAAVLEDGGFEVLDMSESDSRLDTPSATTAND